MVQIFENQNKGTIGLFCFEKNKRLSHGSKILIKTSDLFLFHNLTLENFSEKEFLEFSRQAIKK